MAGIHPQDFTVRCLALVLLVCPYVCNAITPCQQNCSCSTYALSNANSEYHGSCVCPEYGIVPNDVLQNVDELKLGYSQPVVLRLGNIQKFQQIKRLNMSGLQFVEPGGFWGLGTLELLCLYNNFMRVLETAMFTNLQNLTILKVEGTAKNKIHALENGTFLGLQKLTQLYLKDNAIIEITEEHFRDLESLEVLHLSNNKLTQIRADTFIQARKLKQIILSSNLITEIHQHAFTSLNRLEKLTLDGNKIKGMPQPFVFSSLSLGGSHVGHVEISLDKNPLLCDCHLNWISSCLVNDVCYGLCHTPSNFQGKSLEQVYKDGLPQCRPNNTVLSVEPGEKLKLTCSFGGASWMTPDGRRFQEHGDCEDPFYLTSEDSLLIWKTTPDLAGNYTCYSSDGTQALFYQVEVNDLSSPLTIAIYAGIAVSVLLVVVMAIVLGNKIYAHFHSPEENPPPEHPPQGNPPQGNPPQGNPPPEHPPQGNPPQGNRYSLNSALGNPHPRNLHPGNDGAGANGDDRFPLLPAEKDRASPILAQSYQSIFKKDSLSDKNVNIFIPSKSV